MMFRELSPVEELEFRKWAQENDPPGTLSWEIYHPVCREVWIARGIDRRSWSEKLLGMMAKIKAEQERLENFEEQLGLAEPWARWELEDAIDKQAQYLASLNEGLQEFIHKGGK